MATLSYSLTLAAAFFYFICAMIGTAGNCMEKIIKIDHQKTKLFSFKASVHCFPVTLYTDHI